MKSRRAASLYTLLTSRSWIKRGVAVAVLLVTIATLYTQQKGESKAPNDVGHEFFATVIRVIDGDTVKLLTEDNHSVRVRLASIDAPEIGQAYGKAAKKNLAHWIEGKKVQVQVLDKDHYGRVVGKICLRQEDINLIQVQQGFAWHYVHYAKKHQSPEEFLLYRQTEEEARKSRRGLWREKSSLPPWKYREYKRQASATAVNHHLE